MILYNYPKDIKAFYMRLNDDGKTVAAMDVLVPGVRTVRSWAYARRPAIAVPRPAVKTYTDMNNYA